MLQGMVDEAQHVTAGASGSSSSRGKGKSRAMEEPDIALQGYGEDWIMVDSRDEPAHPCPVTDQDLNPFRLMDVPTEIRLEIYRACLTRPYNILLSKRERPQHVEPDDDDDDDDDDMVVLPESPSDASDNDGESSLRVPNRPLPPQGPSGSDRSSSRRTMIPNSLRGLAARGARPNRLLASRTAPSLTGSNNDANANGHGNVGSHSSNSGVVFRSATSRSARFRGLSHNRSNILPLPEPERNQTADPLLVNILRASKEIYKEARGVFYSENMFTLDLNTAMSTLSCLHQRSRRQIKHVELEIPTYNEILERFQETVRLSLRYCSGLKKLVIHMPFTLPGADGSGTTGNTTVYANGFDILRWLPQECAIELKGNICTEIETVVNKHLHLAKTLDKVRFSAYQAKTIYPWEYEAWTNELSSEEKKDFPDLGSPWGL